MKNSFERGADMSSGGEVKKMPDSFDSDQESRIDYWALRAEKKSALTDRTLEAYIDELGLTKSDLEGKRILDIGSGAKETFSKQAAEYGAEVFSINPKLEEKKIRNTLTRKSGLAGWIFGKQDPEWQKRSVAARAQELPFKTSSFDMATALWSISYYLDQEAQLQSIQEIMRSLKPGGMLRMFPRSNVGLDSHQKYPTEKVIGSETIRWLEDKGHIINDADSGPIIITKNPDSEGVSLHGEEKAA